MPLDSNGNISGETPGNGAIWLRMVTRCIFCSHELLPGDMRWFCQRCFVRNADKTLGELYGWERFSMEVSPVRNYSEVE